MTGEWTPTQLECEPYDKPFERTLVRLNQRLLRNHTLMLTTSSVLRSVLPPLTHNSGGGLFGDLPPVNTESRKERTLPAAENDDDDDGGDPFLHGSAGRQARATSTNSTPDREAAAAAAMDTWSGTRRTSSPTPTPPSSGALPPPAVPRALCAPPT